MKKHSIILIFILILSLLLSGCSLFNRNTYTPPKFDKDDEWQQSNTTPTESTQPQETEEKTEPEKPTESKETQPDVNAKDTWECPYCKGTSTGSFCSHCGRPRPSQKWFCSYCGNGNKADKTVCDACGKEKVETVDHKSDKTLDEICAENKLVMVNVFATWCGPCVYETPELEKIYQEYKDRGFVIVGIRVDTPINWTTINSLMDKAGASYPVIATNKTLSAKFPVTVVPTTFFLDSNGKQIGDPIMGVNPEGYRARIEELLK